MTGALALVVWVAAIAGAVYSVAKTPRRRCPLCDSRVAYAHPDPDLARCGSCGCIYQKEINEL